MIAVLQAINKLGGRSPTSPHPPKLNPKANLTRQHPREARREGESKRGERAGASRREGRLFKPRARAPWRVTGLRFLS